MRAPPPRYLRERLPGDGLPRAPRRLSQAAPRPVGPSARSQGSRPTQLPAALCQRRHARFRAGHADSPTAPATAAQRRASPSLDIAPLG
eukprot:10410684-Alexandrium_andersonii.AAC.1